MRRVEFSSVALGAALATLSGMLFLGSLAILGARTYSPPVPMACELYAPRPSHPALVSATVGPERPVIGRCFVGRFEHE